MRVATVCGSYRHLHCAYLSEQGGPFILRKRDTPLAMRIFPLILLTVAGVVLAWVAGALALRERPSQLALPTAVLMGCVGYWGLFQAVGFATTQPTLAVLLEQWVYLGAVVVPVAFFLVAAMYAGYERCTQPRMIVALSVIPVISAFLAVTNARHGLF